jgi:asparagine synthase (glutamine-hydrolysing)
MLDHELLELAARIPSRWKVDGARTKWVLKKAYERELPADVLWRQKQHFVIPTGSWLRGPLRPYFEECVLKSGAAIGGMIDQAVAQQVFRSHLAGTGRHGAVLWSLLVLAQWAERYLPSNPAVGCQPERKPELTVQTSNSVHSAFQGRNPACPTLGM